MKISFKKVALVAAFGIPQLTLAFEWVTPGEYTFGYCGSYGGHSAPTEYRNQKYYSQYSCNKAYNEQDRCYVIAQGYQRTGMPKDCNRWLERELRQCQSFVRQAGRECYQLSQ